MPCRPSLRIPEVAAHVVAGCAGRSRADRPCRAPARRPRRPASASRQAITEPPKPEPTMTASKCSASVFMAGSGSRTRDGLALHGFRLAGHGGVDVPERARGTSWPKRVTPASPRAPRAPSACWTTSLSSSPHAQLEDAGAHHRASRVRAFVEAAVEARGVAPQVRPLVVVDRLRALQVVVAALGLEAHAVRHDPGVRVVARHWKRLKLPRLHGEVVAQAAGTRRAPPAGPRGADLG